jgi:hypothetical protein
VVAEKLGENMKGNCLAVIEVLSWNTPLVAEGYHKKLEFRIEVFKPGSESSTSRIQI